MKHLAFVAGALGLALASAAAQAATAYRLVDLGADVVAYDINNLGQVVGSVAQGSNPLVTQGFVWSAGGGMQTLPVPAGTSGFAAALNDHGQVLLNYSQGTVSHALLWSASGTVALAPLPGFEGTLARSINNAGQVAGVATHNDGEATVATAFLFSTSTGTQNIGPGGLGSSGLKVNGLGQVMMDTWNDPSTTGGPGWHVPTVRTAAGQYVDLGLPTDANGDRRTFFANGFNNLGQLVGGADDGRAFLWGPRHGLTYLMAPGQRGNAFAINDREQVAGDLFGSDGSIAPALWQPGSGWIRLSDLVDPSQAGLLNGLWLADINVQGQMIGNVTIAGHSHAILLTPVTLPVPEPPRGR